MLQTVKGFLSSMPCLQNEIKENSRLIFNFKIEMSSHSTSKILKIKQMKILINFASGVDRL